MARVELRNRANASGEWFVDTRCIDCGTCREVAPDLFGLSTDQSVVARQPSDGEVIDAWLAAQACPTQSIGTLHRAARPGRLYPREIEPNSGVFDVGYCSPDSFGASAWFIRRQTGNLLIDSPRFTEALAGPFEEMGGIGHVLLTHRDDVADAWRWSERFGAQVWIHADDASAAPFATNLLHGLADVEVAPGVVAVAVPGHTKGSVVFVVDERYLFSGDSLAWSHEHGDLTAFRGACWYSWTEQTASLTRLAATHRFSWVLPGHGARFSLDQGDLHDRLVALTSRMAATA